MTQTMEKIFCGAKCHCRGLGIALIPESACVVKRLRENVKELPNGCLEWTRARAGKKHRNGRGQYPCLRVSGSIERGHRLAYRLWKGEIPPGVHVLHRCDNSLCVNPDHLYLGTNAKNMADKAARGRAPAKLSKDDVRTIRERYAAGEFQRVIAEDYGLNQGCVSHIVNRDYWRHV